MKKTMLIGSLLLILVSCGKNKKNECDITMAKLAGNWKTTSVKYKPSASSAEVDYYNYFFGDACDRDDYLTLNANGTYQFVDAGVVCFPNNNSSGTWTLSGNVLTMDSSPSTIDDFSCNTIVYKTTNVFISGDILVTVATRQ